MKNPHSNTNTNPASSNKMLVKLWLLAALIPTMASQISCIHRSKVIASETDQHAKPELVVLLHGYGRSSRAMATLESFFQKKHYKVANIEYSSMTQDIDEIKHEVEQKINKALAQSHSEVKKIHFVGHSLGGLLIRSYLQNNLSENNSQQLGRVVLLGSPSKGTPLVDHLKEKWWFFLAGPAVHALSSEGSTFLKNLERPTYELGVIAGDIENKNRENILPGKDDGMVQVESTKIPGMKEHLVFPVHHSAMRSDPIVCKHIARFLETGTFQNLNSPI